MCRYHKDYNPEDGPPYEVYLRGWEGEPSGCPHCWEDRATWANGAISRIATSVLGMKEQVTKIEDFLASGDHFRVVR